MAKSRSRVACGWEVGWGAGGKDAKITKEHGKTPRVMDMLITSMGAIVHRYVLCQTYHIVHFNYAQFIV